MRVPKQGLRVPDVQLTARHRTDDSGVDIAVLSPPPPARSRRREFPTVERIGALEAQRDVFGLLALRDAVLADLHDGTLRADDATTGGTVLARIEQALLRLAGGKPTVALSDRPGGRQAAQDAPLSQRVEQAKAALRGERPATYSELGRQRVEVAHRALSAETQQDRELSERVAEAREALRLR